jgi:hypothetical protein
MALKKLSISLALASFGGGRDDYIVKTPNQAG